jgi:MFS transporter, SP family, galactose:H+ symporter
MVGVLVCANQHLNGNIGIVFYSSLIFQKAGVSVMVGNFIILLANLLGNFPGFFLLQKIGRRPLLLWSMAAVSVMYVLMSLAAIHDWPLILLIATSLVLFVLQFAILPLGFLYINEACNHKALSIGVGANWFLLVITGIGTGPLFTHQTVGPYAFLMFSGSNAIVLVILTLFMKETKDLSERQLAQLYLNDSDQYSAWGWSNKEVKIVSPVDGDVQLSLKLNKEKGSEINDVKPTNNE